ncbi:Uncharacterized protein APZ42_021321 [Daphnia magna]|uniref:Uncharacterized protein n=1 Tax=Daphnia magna TaxID=35525 RepID=A0A164WSE7_9CRUS|nr:Uncharacterized protein APZ42_021321 [Daphnia magna]
MDINKLYTSLFESYVEAFYPSKTKQVCQKHITEYKSLGLKKKGALCNFWGTLPKKFEVSGLEKTVLVIPIEFSPDSDQFKEPISSVQDEIKKQIGLINGDLVGLFKRRSCGQLTGDQEVELKKTKKEKDDLEDLRKKNIDAQKRQQKFRIQRKKTPAELCETNQEISKALKVRDKIGCPRLEIEQPDLMKAIVDITLYGSAAHKKIVMLKKHLPGHQESPNLIATQSVPTRPVKARRQRELMAVIPMQENGKHVDWVDEDDLDVTGIILPQEDDVDDHPMPVITMEEHFTGAWEEEIKLFPLFQFDSLLRSRLRLILRLSKGVCHV